MYRTGQKFQFLDGQVVYWVKFVYQDGAIEASDARGDIYTFEKAELKNTTEIN